MRQFARLSSVREHGAWQSFTLPFQSFTSWPFTVGVLLLLGVQCTLCCVFATRNDASELAQLKLGCCREILSAMCHAASAHLSIDAWIILNAETKNTKPRFPFRQPKTCYFSAGECFLGPVGLFLVPVKRDRTSFLFFFFFFLFLFFRLRGNRGRDASAAASSHARHTSAERFSSQLLTR